MRLQFAEFLLDSDSRLLLRDGDAVHLSRKAFDALGVLIERRPKAVTKDELHQRLWPGTHVVEASLSVAIAEIRRALGDDPQSARFIRTVHRIGYAFCAEASEVAEPSGVPPGGQVPPGRREPPRAWLAYDGRVGPLTDGENLIGRDPACGVWLDASGVSRRHARLVVSGDASTIEDLGSKNGTWLNDVPVTTPSVIGDGDRIQVGPVTLEFRTSSRASATETVRLRRPHQD